MSRIEVNGIYKHAPLTNAQMATTKRNLDREVVIMRDAVTDRATLIPPVTDPTTDASAYPTNYIYAMDYDSTDDGGDNPNIRRHIPTLELLGSVGDDTAGSNWISIQTNAEGTYNYLSGGETLQAALEALDTQLAGSTLKYISDSSTIGSITTSSGTGVPTNTNSGGDYQITLGVGHTLTSSSNSSILGGAGSTISGASTYSAIVTGVGNSIRAGSQYGFIGSSEGSYIDSSDYSAVVAGGAHAIDTGSNYSFIGSGGGSSIGASVSSAIVGGSNQTINASAYSIIGSGDSNDITAGSTHSIIGSGYDCYIDSSPYSVINGGYQNYIDGVSDYGVIGGGIHNYILDCRSSIIGAGTENYIHPNPTWPSYNNAILAGSQNRVTAIGYVTSGNFIGAGAFNWIEDTIYSSIVSGNGNYIDNGPLSASSNSCFIGAGTANAVQAAADSAVVSGLNNYVTSCDQSGITFGWGNYINASAQSSIGGGNINRVYHSDKAGILGGFNNEISFSNYSFVGGGSTNYIRTTISRDTYSVIAGGLSNYIDGYYATYSFIGSGESNNIGGDHSVITGGKNNSISDIYNFIGGGEDNSIAGESSYSAVICGDTNSIANTSLNSFVGGGSTNAISIANNSAILAGNLNKLDNSTNSVIVAGFTNYIYNGSHISFIGSGQYNYIYQGDSNVICGGGYNQIYASTDIAFIGGGVRNKIFDASNGSVIVGGTGNLIYESSNNCFVGGGYNNYIYGNSNQSSIFGGIENTIREGSTLSAIIGGANNHIIGTVTSSFILGSNINTASYARSYTTFMNRVFLWENAFELKDKPFNVGDVLMVESDVGGVPYVTWGAAPSTNTYSGLDPIATSAGTYSVKSQGKSIILSNYISINNAENGVIHANSTSLMMGTDFTFDGFIFSDYTFINYNDIYGDVSGISTQSGLEILDGFSYDIKVKNINLTWKGPYLKNPPSLSYAYSGDILVTRNGTTRTIAMGNSATVNVIGTTNKSVVDQNPIYNAYGSSDSSDTATPYLFLRYNATNNQLNFAIAELYAHHKYVYKAPARYNSVDTDSFFTIDWPVEIYELPSTGSSFIFWNGNPATTGSLGTFTVADVVGNIVTVNNTFGNITNAPCWIYVPGKLPYLTATFDLDITKTAV